MTTKELYLKTIFCCIACDGDIAKEEIEMIRTKVSKDKIFEGLNVKSLLDKWIAEINDHGSLFLKAYLNELADASLSEQEQLDVVDLAIKAIEADNRIEYSEVKFFKKIRVRLSINDDAILKLYPNREDFLLPDINVADDPSWNDNIKFERIIVTSSEEK